MAEMTGVEFAQHLIATGQAEAWWHERAMRNHTAERRQLIAKYGEEVADAHLARCEGYARRFLPHLYDAGSSRSSTGERSNA